MIGLYLLPPWMLVCLPLLLAAALSLQTCALVRCFYRVRYRRLYLPEFLLEGTVWLCLLLQAVMAAQAIYQIDSGFVAVDSYAAVRLGLYGVLLILSALLCLRSREPGPLSAPAIGLMTLPVALQAPLMAGAFPLSLVLWSIRAVQRLKSYRREKLSAASVKEALDTMDQGLLFFRHTGFCAGQILLANRRIQELMFTLTGGLMYDGTEFCRRLREQAVAGGCRCHSTGEPLLYELPDGSVWKFQTRLIPMKHTLCTLLTASDVTRIWQTTEALNRQNRELEQRNRQLKQMLLNLELICRSEETVRLKALVHDLLGQKITVLLRSVREHQELDESLLQSFAHGLPEELKKSHPDYGHTLKMLIADFRGLGIRLNTTGEFPERSSLRKAFFEITAEALTNSVHHGYATQIDIQVCAEPAAWTLTISDNGLPGEEPIMEGGGLSGMRRRAQALGGTFRYEVKPHFSIFVRIPEEDGS